MRLVGRAFVVDRQRAAAVRHGAVVDHGDALGRDLLAHQAGEGRGLFAVEVAFEPVTDRFVQHDAGPARAEHHVHLAGGRRYRFEIDQGLADGVVDRALPGIGGDETLVAFATAIAVAAGFLAVAVADHDRDGYAHQRPHVTIGLAVGPQNLDRLPGRGDAGRHLAHPRILGAGIGIDGLQKLRFGFEGRRGERAVVAVKLHIGARRRLGVMARIAALDRAHRIGRPLDRRLRYVRGMSVADRFVLDRTQTETLRGVVSRLFEPAVIEGQRFGLAIFEKQFAVIGAVEAARDDFGKPRPVEPGAVDERNGGIGHCEFLLRVRPYIVASPGDGEGRASPASQCPPSRSPHPIWRYRPSSAPSCPRACSSAFPCPPLALWPGCRGRE